MARQLKPVEPGKPISIKLPVYTDKNVLKYLNNLENRNATLLELIEQAARGPGELDSRLISFKMDFELNRNELEIVNSIEVQNMLRSFVNLIISRKIDTPNTVVKESKIDFSMYEGFIEDHD